MKYKVQEMMIESNANEVAIDKYAQPKFETLEKMEQPKADIEKAIKNWEKEKINRTEKPRTKIRDKNSRRKTERDETGASKIKQNKRGR